MFKFVNALTHFTSVNFKLGFSRIEVSSDFGKNDLFLAFSLLMLIGWATFVSGNAGMFELATRLIWQ